MIKVCIVDDQALMREGLKTILESYEDIKVIATGENGYDAIHFCETYDFDVLLLDIRMPKLGGVETVKHLKQKGCRQKILILTTFDDEDAIIEAIAHGASGYVFKDIDYDELLKSIKSVHGSSFVMPSKVAQVLANQFLKEKSKANLFKTYDFTSREIEVLKCLKQGLSNKMIAQSLFISEGTVKNYLTALYQKTSLSQRQELIEFSNKNV